MPWDDDTPPYEEVPYSEADAAPYEEDEFFAPSPLPEAPAPQPTQAARPTPAPRPAPEPAAPVAPRPAPKPAPQPTPQPQPAPQPEPTPEPAPAAQPTASAPTDDEAAAIMSMLTDVFGEGVTMSTVTNPPAGSGSDEE